MSQFGMNCGSRSARSIGYAKSYKTHLPLKPEDYVAHDTDIIGAAGIFWSLILSSMPTEVTSLVTEKLEENAMPHLASQHVKQVCP